MEELRGEKNYVVTGIPRSGTSLTCTLLNASDDSICFNETVTNPAALPSYFLGVRRRIARGQPVENRFDADGKLTTDTLRSGGEVQARIIDGEPGRFTLGVKATTTFLAGIEYIVELGYPVIVLVRDPVDALLSWNSDKAAHTPEHNLTPHQKRTRYAEVNFLSSDKTEMQAQIWEHFASKIWEWRTELNIVKYEHLAESTEEILEGIEALLGVKLHRPLPDIQLRSDHSRYDPDLIGAVRQAVSRYCPSRRHYGYE
ncbi:MAG: sulfotransferase [Myxococcota bacterium]